MNTQTISRIQISNLERQPQMDSPFYVSNGWIFTKLSILANKCLSMVLHNANSEVGLFRTSIIYCVFLSCCIIYLSLPPFLSVYKRSSSDGAVPNARQAWWIRMAGDSGDSDLQHSQPAASVYRLCQLRAEVSPVGHKNMHVFMCWKKRNNQRNFWRVYLFSVVILKSV